MTRKDGRISGLKYLTLLKWAESRDKYLGQEGDLCKLLGDPTCIKNTIKFLHETELLNQFRKVQLPVPTENKENQPPVQQDSEDV